MHGRGQVNIVDSERLSVGTTGNISYVDISQVIRFVVVDTFSVQYIAFQMIITLKNKKYLGTWYHNDN